MTEEEFRYKNLTVDQRLLEILRNNFRLHLRRASTWRGTEAYKEAIEAMRVRARYQNLTDRPIHE